MRLEFHPFACRRSRWAADTMRFFATLSMDCSAASEAHVCHANCMVRIAQTGVRLAPRVKYVRAGEKIDPGIATGLNERTKPLMVADRAALIFTAANSIPRKTRNRRHLKGGHICADSKHYSVQQHCSRAWLWRQRRKPRSKSASASSRFARTATTITRPMPAHRWAFTGQGISTTASSSGWAHGPTGVMVTAGADIASAAGAAEDIAAAEAAIVAAVSVAAVSVVAVHVADGPAQVMALLLMAAHLMDLPTPQLRMVVAGRTAVVDMPVKVDMVAAANTANL